jgi:hypothetical protein
MQNNSFDMKWRFSKIISVAFAPSYGSLPFGLQDSRQGASSGHAEWAGRAARFTEHLMGTFHFST